MRASKEIIPKNFRLKGAAFAYWLGMNYYQQQDEDDCIERVCDGYHDCGIDAMFVDSEVSEIHIVQTTHVDQPDNMNKNLPASELETTFSGIRLINGGDYREVVNPKLEQLCIEYHELLNTGEYKVTVDFFYTKKEPKDWSSQTQFQKDFPDIEVRHFDVEKINELFELSRYDTTPPPSKVTLSVQVAPLRWEKPIKSVVAVVSGRDIAKLYLDHGVAVLQRNVRYGLGATARSINRGIEETASDEDKSEYFWYYNNGLTIVCKDFNVPPNGKVIAIQSPQIINGTQTTVALAEAFKSGKIKQNVHVLAKIIATNDNKLVESITQYTNSQNPIRLRDLSSNEPEQTRLQYDMRVEGYFYERKRGEFKTLYPTNEQKAKAFGPDYRRKIVDNEMAAQAYVAFWLGHSGDAKREKSRLFDKTNPLYSKVFGKHTKAEDLIVSYFLLGYVASKRKFYYQQLASAEREDNKRYAELAKYDFLIYSDMFVLDLLRDYLEDAKIPLSSTEEKLSLAGRTQNSDLQLDALYEQIKESLKDAIEHFRTQVQRYYHTWFFKSDKNLGMAREWLRSEKGMTFLRIRTDVS